MCIIKEELLTVNVTIYKEQNGAESMDCSIIYRDDIADHDNIKNGAIALIDNFLTPEMINEAIEHSENRLKDDSLFNLNSDDNFYTFRDYISTYDVDIINQKIVKESSTPFVTFTSIHK